MFPADNGEATGRRRHDAEPFGYVAGDATDRTTEPAEAAAGVV